MPTNPPPLPLHLPPELRARGLVVAFSGGADSTALLHGLAALKLPRLRAVHVHHGLQAAADGWADHCTRQCAALGVALAICRVAVDQHRQGPEAAARAARYAALRQAMQADEVLVTAHHQDDQAETLLLRLLRGSGVFGLAAMPELRRFDPGWLWRPWLDLPRARLRAYVVAHGLTHVEDAHNQDPRYARSFLRQVVMPQLQQRWPGANRALARSARLQADAVLVLRERAADDLAAMQRDRPGAMLPAFQLRIADLLQLSPPRQRNLLRHWIESQGLPLPFHDGLSRLDRELFGARADAMPVLRWPGAELRRYRDTLFLLAPLPPPAAMEQPWSGTGDCLLPAGCGQLHGSTTLAAGGPYTVQVPVPPQAFRPARSARARALKNLFQERGIPPWVRLRTPALLRQGEVCWIGGIGWRHGLAPLALEWRDRPAGAHPEPDPEPDSAADAD